MTNATNPLRLVRPEEGCANRQQPSPQGTAHTTNPASYPDPTVEVIEQFNFEVWKHTPAHKENAMIKVALIAAAALFCGTALCQSPAAAQQIASVGKPGPVKLPETTDAKPRAAKGAPLPSSLLLLPEQAPPPLSALTPLPALRLDSFLKPAPIFLDPPMLPPAPMHWTPIAEVTR